jgi:hypothetical protein
VDSVQTGSYRRDTENSLLVGMAREGSSLVDSSLEKGLVQVRGVPEMDSL